MAVLIPPGYAGVVPLTITNPSTNTALGGSTTTPVGTSSTDYVVTVQLTGGQASAVYSGALDQSTFTDVTAWWTDGSGVQHQLDVDYDVTSNGAWSSSNVTLRFRLQASIAASASDTNYLIAFGHPNPNVLRTFANLYPFSDTFSGTTLGSQWSTSLPGGTSAVVNNGLTITVPSANNSLASVVGTSGHTFGPSSMVEALATALHPLAGSNVFSGVGLGGCLVGPRPSSSLCSGISSFQLIADPPSHAWGSFTLSGAIDSAQHWWRVARDSSGASYAYLDARSQNSTSQTATYYTNAVAPYLFVANNGNTQAGQITVAWVKVRPWPGPGLEAQTSAGAVQYRSGTTLTSTPSSGPLVRAGAPSIVRSDSTHWLALYSDNTHATSRNGTTAAGLASASDQVALSSAASVQGAALLSAASGTVVTVGAQTGGSPAVAVYSQSGGTWSAGTATGLPSGAVFAGDTYTSGPTTSWHLLSAAPSGTSIVHWVATTAGGPWTALSSATVVALPASDPCLAIGSYAGKVLACSINGSGFVTYAQLDNLNATGGGSTVAGSTLALTNGALAASENLALRNSLDGGAGDLYLAYNNNLGICVRFSAAGGPLSWSAEVQVSATASDKCPTLVRDGTGAITLFWIGGGSGNPILSQRLQVVSGSLFLTGSTLTQTNYAANRSLLSCVPSEPSGLVGLVWLES